MKKIIVILISLATIYGCRKGEVTGFDGQHPIYISASILSGEDGTKSPYTLTVPTSKDSLTAAIWASTTKKNYKGTQKTEPDPEKTSVIDYHNSTCFTSGYRQLLDHQLFYPSAEGHQNDTVFFVGFCPRSQDGWAVEGTEVDAVKKDTLWNIARFEFDGKTDVMFANEQYNWYNMSSKDLNLRFRHMLTWLRFYVVADKEAVDAWGNIKKITLQSKKEIHINISDETARYDKTNDEFPTYVTKKDVFTNTVFENQKIELTTTAQEIAYTLCAAVEAGSADGENEYTVNIETEYRPSTTVNVNLKAANGSNYSGLTDGRQFNVVLKFMLGDNITIAATVSEWQNAGIGIAPIEE